MIKKVVVFCLLVSCITSIVFAEGDPAYFVKKIFRQDVVNVDGDLLSVRAFTKICKEKSPRAVEQLKLCRERRGQSNFSDMLGWVSAIVGFNKYQSSKKTTDNKKIIARQAEGIGYMLIGAVLLVNAHTAGIAAHDAHDKAIEFYNRDTGRRIKVSLGMETSPIGFSLSKRL